MYGIKNAGMQVLKMSINVQVLQKLFINIKKKGFNDFDWPVIIHVSDVKQNSQVTIW